jgi:arginyl-tRNA synthetase
MGESRGELYINMVVVYFCRSIQRTANVEREKLAELALNTPVQLLHPKELKLAKCLIRFPGVILRLLDDLYLHLLCEYLYELATTLTEFYDACYCVEKDRSTGEVVTVNYNRLLLLEATAQVMEKAFYILGIDPVSKM